MKNKIIYALIFIIFSTSVYSLGLAPSKNTFFYEPGKIHEGEFRIITENYPINIEINIQGKLKDYISLEKKSFKINSKETNIKYSLSYDELSPGQKMGRILVREIPFKTPGNVVASPEIIHQVFVNAPKQGKHISAKLIILKDENNKNVLTIPVKNIGNEKINNIYTEIKYINVFDKNIKSTTTDSISLDINEEKKFVNLFLPEKPGRYLAEIIVHFDGKNSILKNSVLDGTKDIIINDIVINNFKLGSIAKFDFYLQNNWNEEFEATGRFEIDLQNNNIKQIDIQPMKFEPRTETATTLYWDTTNIQSGKYVAKLILDSKDKILQKDLKLIVLEDSLIVEGFEKRKYTDVMEKYNYLFIGIFVLTVFTLIIILWTFGKRKLKRKRHRKKKERFK